MSLVFGQGDHREHRCIQLPTGELSVYVTKSDLPLDDLCGFAARQNPKRGFLFVSKVLGKHIPTRPSVMRSVQRRLAQKIPADLPGPVVVVGMAETAIGLGHGVYEEYVALSGRDDVLFIHSTRYRLEHPVAIEFREEHSHAVDHRIHWPEATRDRELFQTAGSLVLVDDETSTGSTFVNLACAFQAAVPSLESIVTVVVTDWRNDLDRIETEESMPVPARSVALLEGVYQFTPAANLTASVMPNATGNGAPKDQLLQKNYGRLGLGKPLLRLSPRWGQSSPDQNSQPFLILGTGEFVYPPFLMAELLEKTGVHVYFQSTTRSPIWTGHAIETALTFSDNYDDSIANYLYNVRAEDYKKIIVCHETPASTLDRNFLHALQAKNVEF